MPVACCLLPVACCLLPVVVEAQTGPKNPKAPPWVNSTGDLIIESVELLDFDLTHGGSRTSPLLVKVRIKNWNPKYGVVKLNGVAPDSIADWTQQKQEESPQNNTQVLYFEFAPPTGGWKINQRFTVTASTLDLGRNSLPNASGSFRIKKFEPPNGPNGNGGGNGGEIEPGSTHEGPIDIGFDETSGSGN